MSGPGAMLPPGLTDRGLWRRTIAVGLRPRRNPLTKAIEAGARHLARLRRAVVGSAGPIRRHLLRLLNRR